MQIKSLAIAAAFTLVAGAAFAESDQAVVEVSVNGNKVTPQSANYPKMALRRRVEGEVVIEFTINSDGKAEDIEIVDAQPKGFFDRSAIQAVKNAQFQPVSDAGKVADGKIQQKYIYSLDPSITKGADTEG